eukprot:Gregarina_sp_Poly_1__6729@NODE_361_length_9223_cov_159_738751_g298_i0_p1_GENE_NODE_361_length_9223_cov_159_738751_g298_i0NODE_361_length_9223_cov_159_738751_g298_i0_p1_ORF_typecomplete_len1985_score330_78Arm_2/PF04826_13/28Arm_2/PF04826_13/8_6Arm_2/PF04826_13/0_0017Arm_2/PF04826_13/31KAP/PF05804_12/5_7KAP/PF05804_12/6_7e05CDC14/PF08045_11/2_1CDC14/PF08045_11/1_2e02CDC14/PF08045_11/2e03VATPase_H_N/PF03224_14/7e02VATPase_H_N/PF03224_14/0_78Atx10homo_assoc/PF09759_9/5_7Atx10homo_assoc/PF09759_9/76Y
MFWSPKRRQQPVGLQIEPPVLNAQIPPTIRSLTPADAKPPPQHQPPPALSKELSRETPRLRSRSPQLHRPIDRLAQSETASRLGREVSAPSVDSRALRRRLSPTGACIASPPPSSRSRGLAHNPSPVSGAAGRPAFPFLLSPSTDTASRASESALRRQTVSEYRLSSSKSPAAASEVSQLTSRGPEVYRDRSPIRSGGAPRVVPLLPPGDVSYVPTAPRKHTVPASTSTAMHRPPLSSLEPLPQSALLPGPHSFTHEVPQKDLVGVPVDPLPGIMNKVTEAQESPEKFRDAVVGDLLNQLRGVPVLPDTPAVCTSTAAAVLDQLANEMDRPLRDHAAATRDLKHAFRKAVEVAAVAPPRDVNTVRLLEATGRVTRKKARRERDSAAQDILASGLATLFARSLNEPAIVQASPEFARDALQALSNGLTSTVTRGRVRSICQAHKTPERAMQIATDKSTPWETSQAAAEFGMLYSDAPPEKAYLAQRAAALGSSQAQSEPIMLEVMMRVVARRVRGKGVNKSVERSLSQMLNEPLRDQSKEDLEKLVKAFDTPENIRNPNLATKFAELVGSYAARDRDEEIGAVKAHEVLLRVLRAHPDDMIVVGKCLDAFSYLAENNPVMSGFVAESVIPAIRVPSIVEDPDVVCQYVDTLEDLVVNGDAQVLKMLPKAKVIQDMDLLESIADPLDSELLSGIADIRAALNQKRSALTLKEVYSVLLARQHNDDSLNINEDRTMKRMYHYVCKKVREYGVDQEISDGIFGFTGSEFMYGCMCFQVLASVEDNHTQIIRQKVPSLLLEALGKQTDEQVAQHAVLTGVELASIEKIAHKFVDTQEKKDLIVSVLERGRRATEYDMYNEVEDLVGARVQFIERTALTRDTYKRTQALSQLIDTWDDYDFFWYGNIRVKDKQDLARLFKVERREQRKDFFKDVMRKHRDHKERKAAPAAEGSGDGLMLRRRSSLFGTRKQLRSQDEGPTLTVSPLERRKSVVMQHKEAAGMTSPLERRRSVMGARRGSLGGSPTLPLDKPSGLVRRASQFFQGTPKPQPQTPTTSVALARRASMSGSATIQRRASLLHKEKSVFQTPTALNLADTPGGARASALQRRASMVSPTANSSMAHLSLKLNRHFSNKSGEGDTSTKSGKQSSRSNTSSSSHWSEEGAGEGVFVPRMLEFVFKAIRKVIEPEALNYLESRNVPMRLVGVIADLDTPPAAFPDVLFLVGTLAPLGSMKDKFHGYKAVEKICNLLRRAYKQNGSFVSEVVTNACLALATLSVVHLPNTKAFQKRKGPELIVATLAHRGQLNDHRSVNAACALLCNLCYKNEDMKVALGQEGACEAVVKAMGAYQCSSAEAGSKNIASLFKAIGNLALNQDNMERMMASEIDVAFSSFMGEADEELDDPTVEACLRTLSNLVIEKDNMARFERVVVPLLSLLRKEIHTSAEIHRWAFLTIANLCRWPPNSKTFCRNDGLRTIVIRLPGLEKSAGLKASVITALGIQTTFPENIERLVDIGIFDILAETLRDFLRMIENEGEERLEIVQGVAHVSPRGTGVTAEQQAQLILEYSQLPISALRCCHRLLKEPFAAQECINSGVFELAQQVLLRSLFQGMLSYEAFRVMFGCISLTASDGYIPRLNDLMILARQDNKTTSAGSSTVDIYASADDWGETELAMLEQGEDPCGIPGCLGYGSDPTEPTWWLTPPPQVHQPLRRPRLWEQLKMTTRMTDITEIARKIVTNEKALRNVRLQRVAVAWLTWMSCERVCLPSLYRRLDVEIDPDTHHPISEPEDSDIMADTPKMAAERRRSVWDTFKRDKKNKKDAQKEGFGRQRKIDLTSCVDIIRRVVENLWFDQDCLDLAMILLNNLVFCSFGHEELSNLIADVNLYKALKKMIDLKGESAKPYGLMTLRNYKRFLQTESKFGVSPVDDEEDAESEHTKKRNFAAHYVQIGIHSKRDQRVSFNQKKAPNQGRPSTHASSGAHRTAPGTFAMGH